jgi:hypothetical protein
VKLRNLVDNYARLVDNIDQCSYAHLSTSIRGFVCLPMSKHAQHSLTKLLDFSLSVGFGALICFASYNPIKNDCCKDAMFISLVNCGTSVFSGVVVYTILGFREVTLAWNVLSCLSLGESRGSQRPFGWIVANRSERFHLKIFCGSPSFFSSCHC